MMMSACVDRLISLGYDFHLGMEGEGVRVILPGGLPPPPEAAPLLAHLKAHRIELRDELRFRARSTERFLGRQTNIEPPVEDMRQEAKPSEVEQLRATIEALLEYAYDHILELTEAEKDSINDRYLTLDCALKSAEALIDDSEVF